MFGSVNDTIVMLSVILATTIVFIITVVEYVKYRKLKKALDCTAQRVFATVASCERNFYSSDLQYSITLSAETSHGRVDDLILVGGSRDKLPCGSSIEILYLEDESKCYPVEYKIHSRFLGAALVSIITILVTVTALFAKL